MEHATHAFAYHGVIRLSEVSGVSPASISRIINGKQNPQFLLVARLTTALEQAFGIHIDPRDIFAENGLFLTPYACDLVGCRGCYPEAALDQFGNQNPAFQGVHKGEWETSKYPKGYLNQKGVK
jgi:transcriptional regulator with XRE-family HTH domain